MSAKLFDKKLCSEEKGGYHSFYCELLIHGRFTLVKLSESRKMWFYFHGVITKLVGSGAEAVMFALLFSPGLIFSHK